MSLSQLQEPERQGPEQVTDLETDGLEEAEKTWIKDLPPFIDYAIPDSIEPGGQLEVWKAPDLVTAPKLSGPKTLITCRSWKNTNRKYWTCDGLKKNWRHIVGGLGVPNRTGWFAWVVWHGKDHGFTKLRVLWTRLEDQSFIPNVQPLQDGNVAAQTDKNRGVWQTYGPLQAAERGIGTRSQSSLSIGEALNLSLFPSARQAAWKALSSVSAMASLRHRFNPLIRGIDDTPRPKRACTDRQREPSFYSKFMRIEDDDDLPNAGPESLGDVVHQDDESSQGSRPAENDELHNSGLEPLGSGRHSEDEFFQGSPPTEDNNLQNSGLEPFGDERHPDDRSFQRLREPSPSSQLEGSSSLRDNQLQNSRHKRNMVAPVAIMVAPAASSSHLSAAERKEIVSLRHLHAFERNHD